MSTLTASKNPAVLSYYTMRRAVGLIALSLPFALALGSILFSLAGSAHALPHPILQRSISDYYYTSMRDYYIGSLCAIAAFLASTRGYDLTDEIMGFVAGALTLGVAVFPPVNPRSALYTPFQVEIGFIHTGFAALMFLVLAYFCIFLFRRSSPEKPFTRRKQHRNRIYGACGLTIIVCMVMLVSLTVKAVLQAHHPSRLLFWFESVALAAFGIAWLTKGEGILKDKPHNHHRPVPINRVY
ncbi:conserved membrane hypothetical protein [Candidatus Sulfotelmatomonas gaucii]|uniref:DUF998 domain-containing protein n=1 Tax=Candidatus Sulfuritelmatomonas gaucii TaxID=2043161 RepID=A0A2N9LHU6_9BACT|nr:conserved membrane hypothetical protein [Candidatus Sulfotelmatomonas gaucii]